MYPLIGLLIGPLQQYYIGQESFKFQTFQTPGLQGGTDIYDLVRTGPSGNNRIQTARLRGELASVSNKDFQPELWQEGTPHCSSNHSSDLEFSPECYQGGTTFDNIAALLSPYIAQLPSGYQTGLITQFMPRMNSSISYATVSQTDFPQNCNTISGAYYIEYAYNETLLNVQVCMPDDISRSPWRATRDRQDISEQMFLNIAFGTSISPATLDKTPGNVTLKLLVNTTLGYFELPNYNNSGIAGPLLAKDPHDTCQGNDAQCLSQWHSKRSLQINESDSSFAIGRVANQGPLAMIAAAMFDPGSFIATQFPQNATRPLSPLIPGPGIPCTVAPLKLLLGKFVQTPCYPEPLNADEGYGSVSSWLAAFYDLGAMQNALHAAVILASKVWLTSITGRLTVMYDLGQDSERPKISSAGVILLSILLAIDLFLLLALATYISFSYTWTSYFDSSAMMRLGAARSDELPLQIISTEREEKTRAVREQVPGWVGDARPDDDVGVLAIGATAPLKPGRRYRQGTG